MVLKSIGEKSEFLSAAERILLGLLLINEYKSVKWLAGWLAPDYQGKNVYSTLSRLSRQQLVMRMTGGPKDRGKYRISQLGIAWLGRRFPLIVKEGSEPSVSGGDSEVGAVVIDAAEVKGRRRKLIFDELKRWRYGRMSRGFYLTVSATGQAAIAEFVSRYRLGGYVNLMTINLNDNQKAVADRVFRLGERNAGWRLIIDRIGEWQRISGGDSGWRRIREDFLQLLVTEPWLPAQLAPPDYLREKAIEKIKGI